MSRFVALIAVGVFAFPSFAHAYIGPGLALSTVGTVAALLGVILLLVIGFLWYPLKRLMRSMKSRTNSNGQAAEQ